MALIDINRAHTGQAVDIAPGGEHLVATGQQNAAHISIAPQLNEVVRQQRLQLQAQGIGGVRAVEPHQGNPWGRVLQQHRRGK
ncbi:hypothetical protein D3C81_912690 [compost metagenome]